MPEYFADAVSRAGMYVHYTKRYYGSVPTLVTSENVLMDREDRLRRKRDRFNGYIDTRID